jgi:hypothetical protein
MVVEALLGIIGTLPPIKVLQNVKVNALHYVIKVVPPLLEDHLPKLYFGEL